MRVFLSWSGERSHEVAETIGSWLSQVIQAVDPWISTEIDKGSRWSHEVAAQLDEAQIGIICLTPENLNAPWILFEAGALGKNLEGRVCTFLLGLQPTDVKLPLAQFQATTFAKEDVFALVRNINEKLGAAGEKKLQESVLETMFERMWPELEQDLSKIEKDGPPTAKRPKEDLLTEILRTVRRIERSLEQPQELEGSDARAILYNWLSSNRGAFSESTKHALIRHIKKNRDLHANLSPEQLARLESIVSEETSPIGDEIVNALAKWTKFAQASADHDKLKETSNKNSKRDSEGHEGET